MSTKCTPLNIKDAGVYDLARQLADRLGVTLTSAVRIALTETLDRRKSLDDRAVRMEELLEIAEHCASLPVLDNRSADEILGYDCHGLPT
ncbi:MAG: type II toxin-antitoxin system VapB family antitoxin [Capsulimonadaceae bacterium]